LAGNQRTLTDPAGQVTNRNYDAANELVSLTYSDGKTPAVAFAYDTDGQCTSMTDGTGTSSWSYDSLHRITSTKTGAGTTVTYAYDLKGQLTKLTYPGGTHNVSRAYDVAGRMTSLTDWLGNKTTFAYDADGNLVTETLPLSTGVTAKYSYDANSRLTGIVDAKGATNLATFSYTRDALGQLSGASETGVPSAGTDTYTYTALNQLSGVNAGSYSYDAADNVTSLIVPSQVSLHYDTANELTKLTVGTQVTNFAYDARGNRLNRTPSSGSPLTYAYDQANRMTGFGSNATYHYAGDGLRMSKTVGATTEAFTWDRSGILPLLLADGTTNYVYGPDGSPLGYERQDPLNRFDPTGLSVWTTFYNWLSGLFTDVAVNGKNADAAGDVVSGAVNVPGVPGAGPAVGLMLNPKFAVPFAAGCKTVSKPGSAITHQSQLNAILDEDQQRFAPQPSPSPTEQSSPTPTPTP